MNKKKLERKTESTGLQGEIYFEKSNRHRLDTLYLEYFLLYQHDALYWPHRKQVFQILCKKPRNKETICKLKEIRPFPCQESVGSFRRNSFTHTM